MSKNSLFLLLLPSVAFAVLGLWIIVYAKIVDARFFAADPPKAKQNVEDFTRDVQSGSQQVSSERWLIMLRSARESRENIREVSLSVTRFQRIFGLSVLGAAVLQIILVLSIGRRMMPNQPVEGTAYTACD